jgi:hypothetical protein
MISVKCKNIFLEGLRDAIATDDGFRVSKKEVEMEVQNPIPTIILHC